MDSFFVTVVADKLENELFVNTASFISTIALDSILQF